ncbi:MAG: HEAT repeat domain-containing protein [Candidatus Promineifilaceae bacterium]|nr:HEAT repeat domain-containing protein [Candidatus Promineifilaceae bacterium]
MTSLARPTSLFSQTVNARLALLFGQSLSFGVLLGLLIITGSALFLPSYGATALPYVYIVVAVLGSLLFYTLGEMQRRWSLSVLSVAVDGIVVAFFVLSWLVITLTDARWVPFVLMVAFSVIIQGGFVILGGQAGRLFDVRQVKRQFPRVVSGFVLGFLISGLIAPPLGELLGGTENLLLAATASALSMLIFLLLTIKRFGPLLAQSAAGSGSARATPSKPLWQLLAKRFVLLIVAYQLLSAVASQLIDFVLFEQAAQRFSDSAGLTQFFGDYTVVVNLSDFLFLALLAGVLLSRYGLNFGLAANPFIDGLLLAVQLIVGIVLGPTSLAFFWLAMIARVVDITLTDGTTRGSINTAYQALAPGDRASIQTGVEGIGQPAALGLTGVVLLLFNAIPGLTIVHIVAFALLITLLWGVTALLAYRDYATALTQTLRRRALTAAELSLEDSSSLEVVERLLRSPRPSDVRLALDLLEAANHPALADHLPNLVEHADPRIREEALSRIERLQPPELLPAVAERVNKETEPRVLSAALQALSALQGADALETVLAHVSSDEIEVQLGAVVGLLRYGGIPGVLSVGDRLTQWMESADPARRRLGARIIGEVGTRQFYQPLLPLLVDPDDTVRRAALTAAGQVQHPRLLPRVVSNLAHHSTRSAAVTALASFGQAIVPHAADALSGQSSHSRQATVRLVRICGQIDGDAVVNLLKAHMDHKDDQIRHQVLAALHSCGYRADVSETDAVTALLQAEADQAAQLLAAQRDLEASADPVATAPLQRALGNGVELVERRAFLLLSFLYDAQAILRAWEQLASGTGPQQALALEMLEVNLAAAHRTVILPLVTPDLDLAQRAERLGAEVSTSALSAQQRLEDLIVDDDGTYGQWVQACAVYAAVQLKLVALTPLAEAMLEAESTAVRQTAAWALHRLAPERFRAHASALAADDDQLVAQLVRGLMAVAT